MLFQPKRSSYFWEKKFILNHIVSTYKKVVKNAGIVFTKPNMKFIINLHPAMYASISRCFEPMMMSRETYM